MPTNIVEVDIERSLIASTCQYASMPANASLRQPPFNGRDGKNCDVVQARRNEV